jgi:hypothetical protein
MSGGSSKAGQALGLKLLPFLLGLCNLRNLWIIDM